MSDAVFLGRGGQQRGPFTREQLAGMSARGEVLPGDLAWYDGLGSWQPAAQVLAALGVAAPSAPPPLPEAAGIPINPGAPSLPMSDRDMYEAFIGPEKSGYYVPVFLNFDAGGSAASWNWPAGLITQYWMLYRGMFLWGLLWYPILNTAGWIAVGALMASIGPAATGFGQLLCLAGSIAIMGLYGNKIYHSHVRKLIARSATLGLSEQLRREWLIRKGATSFIWVFLVLFIGVAIIGILAAIAIPAYQDYTIRTQVTEGAILADGVKTAVAEYRAQHQSLPAGNADAGLQAPSQIHGQYVDKVEVVNGIIRITYGGMANPLIRGNQLVYVPDENGGATGTLIWHCNTEATTLKNKYLPQVCRR